MLGAYDNGQLFGPMSETYIKGICMGDLCTGLYKIVFFFAIVKKSLLEALVRSLCLRPTFEVYVKAAC